MERLKGGISCISASQMKEGLFFPCFFTRQCFWPMFPRDPTSGAYFGHASPNTGSALTYFGVGQLALCQYWLALAIEFMSALVMRLALCQDWLALSERYLISTHSAFWFTAQCYANTGSHCDYPGREARTLVVLHCATSTVPVLERPPPEVPNEKSLSRPVGRGARSHVNLFLAVAFGSKFVTNANFTM